MNDNLTNSDTHSSLVPGHLPASKEVKYSIGPYQIIGEIGKGGMGEILLAYDTVCGRRIALKKIRDDLSDHTKIHKRFLKEARITSQLSHPAIIPIYDIHKENELLYYTMPFVQGETLKQILMTTKKQERAGKALHHIGGSILSLVRIFLSVCHAVAYAHSKGVLHRDLKPENIIIGPYGEIYILDWGLAKLIESPESEDSIDENYPTKNSLHGITKIGKVVGTIAYMAPERSLGNPATIQTDIYSLGGILYHILSLCTPHKRESLDELRKNYEKEKLINPAERAPFRDVPRVLARISMKCLAADTNERYQTVDELIREIENYIEGRSEWFQIGTLDIKKKSDWEFQENVLIAEHTAITRSVEVSDWVLLMISKSSYSGNTKIEAEVKIGDTSQGLGFLVSVPEEAERKHLNDGYCLWLGSDINRSTKLLRSTVETFIAPEVYLKRGEWYKVQIEKVDHNIYFYLNDVLQFSYISHIPHIGTHLGFISRDVDFQVRDFNIYVGSHSITVNCLAVPDAFLAHKDYTAALTEYRRIGYSFPDRTEGREALFRAGATLLEQARNSEKKKEKEKLFNLALDEFIKLRATPAAPLEYLGKTLVYHYMKDFEEELKCFELCFRRYKKHPMLPVLHEQLVYRMHEYSRYHRKATYGFILLAVRFLPKETLNKNSKRLFRSLKKHWETPYFIHDENTDHDFAIQLAFWLAKPHVLVEIIDEMQDESEFSSMFGAIFSLIELGSIKQAYEKWVEKIESFPALSVLEPIFMSHKRTINAGIKSLESQGQKKIDHFYLSVIFYLLDLSIKKNKTHLVHKIAGLLKDQPLLEKDQIRLDSYVISACLIENNFELADRLLHKHSFDVLTDEKTPLHTLYGSYLYATEGKEIANVHFSGLLDIAFPRSWLLLSYYLNKRIKRESSWMKQSFMWEKRQLYKQLIVFFHCTNDKKKEFEFKKLENREYIEPLA